MASPSVPASPKAFLSEDCFEQKTFSGQQAANIFAPESTQLRTSINTALTSIFSEENLDFLKDVYALNSNKNLSKPELEAGLKEIEKTYITQGSSKQINIEGSAVQKILKSSDKSLADYEDAIKEVFKLIQNNLNPQAPQLAKTEMTIAVRDMAADMNSLIQVPVKTNFLNRLMNQNRDATLFVACQNICKTTQKELRTLASEPVHSQEEFDNRFAEILNNGREKLSAGLKQIRNFENKNHKDHSKSDAIEVIINAIDAKKAQLNLSDPVSKTGYSSTQPSKEESESHSSTPRRMR
jgi:hypothetical protein